jgi:RHH-type proline utilization regulon transcriptional repressor/proline dehydrogenase/delta 1-pyrroline-5-carboxylate dehydrogenase
METEILQQSIAQAEAWQNRANELLTPEEKGIQEQMLRLVTHPMDKVILTRLIDVSFRSEEPARVADQVSDLLKAHGVPDFFSRVEKLLVQMFLGLGRHFPTLSVPKMIEKMRQSSSRAIIAGEPEALHAHLQKRKRQGVRMNLNHLGEAVLGEKEANTRLLTYLNDLENPEIEYISIKISTLFSQINPLAFEQTVETLVDRLARLMETAGRHTFLRHDGRAVPKFINLDMEEYRDLRITAETFRRVLDDERFRNQSAGIALQAYLPDAYPMQRMLTEWARNRVNRGGSPIKIRVVKGANMEMEMVESAIRDWPLAPYDNKLEVDANFKRMVAYGLSPENASVVHLGIGSHNLFELAYAYMLAKKNGTTPYFSFEMLEGMADHVRRAIAETAEELVLYAPVATREQFINAIAYLIRRLDENTSPENFLRYSFHLDTRSEAWELLKRQFLDSLAIRDEVRATPHRTQNRNVESRDTPRGTFHHRVFSNEPDTDWSLPDNQSWAQGIRKKWQKTASDPPVEIPLVVGGEELIEKRKRLDCFDPNTGLERVCVARFATASADDIRRAVAVAKADPDRWRQRACEERHEILSRVAEAIRRARADLIGAAANTGKIFSESDAEVSEAVDFAEYYPHAVQRLSRMPNLKCRGKGVGVVISPWNFPIAIPCGGIAAALAAGNTVVFKPASSAVLVAWQLCKCFWEAGVSKNTLQFLPGSGQESGTLLTAHPEVDFVILTGGTATGLAILKNRPDLYLAAETGGKNATIVTAMSDRDQAIAHVVHSAFSNCGQKCSATSLLILEKEVYQNEKFRAQLVDAAASLPVGSAWDFTSRIGPLIRAPEGNLKRALTVLETGERWALEPRNLDGNPLLWTPGIKYGVTPGSFTHMTELFGPVLGVMEAMDLTHAVALANQTGYGLTGGLESLDVREHAQWKKEIRAGNLYINRGTTGAMVLRQPFGGMGKSALGAAIKVGYANYPVQFMEVSETAPPEIGAIEKARGLLHLAQKLQIDLERDKANPFYRELTMAACAIRSYLYWQEREFSREKDFFHLRGQDNIHRYLPVGEVAIRLHPSDTLFDAIGRIAAARIAGCRPVISLPPGLDNPVTRFLLGRKGKPFIHPYPILCQNDSELILSMGKIQRIRYAGKDRVPPKVLEAAAETGFYVSRAPVMMEGRVELIQYMQNQSISDTYHRYGNIGERGLTET